MTRRMILSESQLRRVIRKSLFENKLLDEILMEVHGILIEGDGFWATLKLLKTIFEWIGCALGICIVLIAIAEVGAATVAITAGGFLAAVTAASTTLAIPCTVIGLINFALSLSAHEKDDKGEWKSKPDWFGAFTGFLGLFGGVLESMKGLASFTGSTGRVLRTLSSMSLDSGLMKSVITTFETSGLTWDIIGPIKDGWSKLLGEGLSRRHKGNRLFEAQQINMKPNEKDDVLDGKKDDVLDGKSEESIDWDALKDELKKDKDLAKKMAAVNELRKICKNARKDKNKAMAFLKTVKSAL